MRKDVRIGFAVGGVLLAVIIVAVLVIHRNKNNAVTFDKGTDSSATDPPPVDIGPGAAAEADRSADSRHPAAAPARPQQPEPDHRLAANHPEGGQADRSDSQKDTGNRWNELFASTAEDPIKAELTSPRRKQKPVEQAKAAPEPLVADPGPVTDPPRRTDRVVLDSATPRSTTIPRTYKIQQGETFSSIAKSVYGDMRYYLAMEKANPTVNPSKLRPGVVINLPPASDVKDAGKSSSAADATTTSKPPRASGGARTYTVQQGESLYAIARKLYGKGGRQDELYALNKDLIGADSARLKPGMVLKLPDAPTVH